MWHFYIFHIFVRKAIVHDLTDIECLFTLPPLTLLVKRVLLHSVQKLKVFIDLARAGRRWLDHRWWRGPIVPCYEDCSTQGGQYEYRHLVGRSYEPRDYPSVEYYPRTDLKVGGAVDSIAKPVNCVVVQIFNMNYIVILGRGCFTCCIDDDLCLHVPLCPCQSVPHVSTSDLTLYEGGGEGGHWVSGESYNYQPWNKVNIIGCPLRKLTVQWNLRK